MSNKEMQALISTSEVEKLMLNIRGKDVLLDRDVARLYGVETKHINKSETQQLIENRDNFAVKKNDHKIKQNERIE